MAPGRLFALELFLQLGNVYVFLSLLQLSNRAVVVIDDGPDRSLDARANPISDVVARHPVVIASEV